MLKLSIEKPIRKYEGIIIVHPDATEEQQKALFKANQEIIKKFRGAVNHLDTWGKRRLANPIDKIRMGAYFHTTFETDADCIAELERTMRINENVLRFFHTRIDDRISLSKFLDNYKETLEATAKREQEKEAKNQARKARFKS